MRPAITLPRLIPAMTSVALLVAACSDGSTSGETVLNTTTTTTAASTTTIAPEPTTTTTAVTTTVVDVEQSTTTAPQRGQGAELSDSARISTIGLGPVYMGDTLEVVAEKIGVELAVDPDEPGSDECRWYTAPGGPPGVTFMVAFNRIARVDIDSPSTITTRSGAGIGSTKDDILTLFGDKIEVVANATTGGEDLVFVPVDEKDDHLRIVFEANADGTVTHFRTGQLPEVDYDGC